MSNIPAMVRRALKFAKRVGDPEDKLLADQYAAEFEAVFDRVEPKTQGADVPDAEISNPVVVANAAL